MTYILNNLVEEWDDQPQYLKNLNWYGDWQLQFQPGNLYLTKKKKKNDKLVFVNHRYFQPVVNPDGYEYSHTYDRLWRKNRSNNGFIRCSGVDLNRNYGYKFGGAGTSDVRCSEIYRGSSAFSEPETLAHKRFFEQTKEKFYAFLTFHSYGQYILYPWGYDKVVPEDHEDLKRVGNLGALVSKFTNC